MKPVKSPKDYTEKKLAFAAIHLNELLFYEKKGRGDDFERAHQESFLFHLCGALDSFLQELNVYYGCQLEIDKVNLKSLEKKIKDISPELIEIVKLRADPNSWISDLFEMRHQAAHRQSIPRTIHIGGEKHGETHLANPRSQKSSGQDYSILFSKSQKEMSELIERLRKSAMKSFSKDIW